MLIETAGLAIFSIAARAGLRRTLRSRWQIDLPVAGFIAGSRFTDVKGT